MNRPAAAAAATQRGAAVDVETVIADVFDPARDVLVLLPQPIGSEHSVGLGFAFFPQQVEHSHQLLVARAARAAVCEVLGDRGIDRVPLSRRQRGVEEPIVLNVTRQGVEPPHGTPPSRPRSLRTARNKWTRTVDSFKPVIVPISRGVQSP